MNCTTFSDLLNKWWFVDKLAVLACFTSVFIFAYSIRLIWWLSRWVKGLLPRKKTEVDKKIETLALEIRQLKSQLDTLSPVAQFAAYFRKERQWKKLKAELDVLVMMRSKDAGVMATISLVVAGILVYVLAAILMLYSRNIILGHISSSYFWPFNFLFYIPNFTPPIDDQYADDGEIPITLFSFLSLVMFVWRRVKWRENVNRKLNKS